MNDDLMRQLYPLPEGRPLRKPRFGRAAAVPLTPLPADVQHGADRPPRPPFALHWHSDELGLTVHVHELDDGQVWAYAQSSRREHLDRAVSVALAGRGEGRLRRVNVPLKDREEEGCSGAAPLGKLAELKDELGPECTLVACLLL